MVGLRFQTQRNSTFIDGARHDARLVVDHLQRGSRPGDGADPAEGRLIPGASPRTGAARRWDAVVVGARCAGAATAMLLARHGVDVLVLDRARRGSDTVSTHVLVRGGTLQLRRWVLLDLADYQATRTTCDARPVGDGR